MRADEPDIDTREIERLEHGPRPDEDDYGSTLASVTAECPEGAPVVLARCREAMRVVLSASEGAWPTDAEWRERLPPWIGSLTAGDPELLARHHLPLDVDPGDAAAGWAALFNGGRSWFWWDAEILDPAHLRVTVATEGFPYSEFTLRWLLVAAGGRNLQFD